MGADLALDLDRLACLDDCLGRVGVGEEFGPVGLDVGQPEDAVGRGVVGGGLVEIAGGGVELEREPVSEVTHPGHVSVELGVLPRSGRTQVGGEYFRVLEPALGHVKVGGPQARGQPGCPRGTVPDLGVGAERGPGLTGDAPPMSGGHGEPRADHCVDGQSGDRFGNQRRDRGRVAEANRCLSLQAPQGFGQVVVVGLVVEPGAQVLGDALGGAVSPTANRAVGIAEDAVAADLPTLEGVIGGLSQGAGGMSATVPAGRLVGPVLPQSL